jgi:hypothetical protein
LEEQLGRVEDPALLHLSQQQQALLRWQQQLNPKQKQQQLVPGKPNASISSGSGQAAAAAALDEASGVPFTSAEQAVLALCGVDPEVAAAAYAAAAGDSGAAAAATAAAFSAALAPKTTGPRVATAAEQAAVEADVFGTKGRVLNDKAGARWLMQWCSRVTGSSGSDDTVATAVCRMLLSGAFYSAASGLAALGSSIAPPTLSQLARSQVVLPVLLLVTCRPCTALSHPVPPCTALYCLCCSAGRNDDEVAAELFDLLGDAVFEHIGACGTGRWN